MAYRIVPIREHAENLSPKAQLDALVRQGCVGHVECSFRPCRIIKLTCVGSERLRYEAGEWAERPTWSFDMSIGGDLITSHSYADYAEFRDALHAAMFGVRIKPGVVFHERINQAVRPCKVEKIGRTRFHIVYDLINRTDLKSSRKPHLTRPEGDWYYLPQL